MNMWPNVMQNQTVVQNPKVTVNQNVTAQPAANQANTTIFNMNIYNVQNIGNTGVNYGWQNPGVNYGWQNPGAPVHIMQQASAPMYQQQMPIMMGGGYPQTTGFDPMMMGGGYPQTTGFDPMMMGGYGMPTGDGNNILSRINGLINKYMNMFIPSMFSPFTGDPFMPENPFMNDPFLATLLSDPGLMNSLGGELATVDGSGSAWGDPHFKFEDSTGEKVTIDHKGKDGETYNILNADGLDIDAEYKEYHDEDNPQVMGAVRVRAGDQELVMHEGKVTIKDKDGREKTLKEGTAKLDDGRKIEIKHDGSVIIQTKDGKGTIAVKEQDGYYDVERDGKMVLHKKDSGGVLGFLTALGLKKTKEEILKEYDTNNNDMLDDKDKEIASKFRTADDIGKFQYDKN